MIEKVGILQALEIAKERITEIQKELAKCVWTGDSDQFNVDDFEWAVKEELKLAHERIAELEAENEHLRNAFHRAVDDNICLNCGRLTPCKLHHAETSGDPDWPGSPCTFEIPALAEMRERLDKGEAEIKIAHMDVDHAEGDREAAEAEVVELTENLDCLKLGLESLKLESKLTKCNCCGYQRIMFYVSVKDGLKNPICAWCLVDKAEAQRDAALEVCRAVLDLYNSKPQVFNVMHFIYHEAKAVLKMNELGITGQDIADTMPPEPGR